MNIPAISGFNQEAFSKYLKNTGWLVIARVGSLAIKYLTGIAVANYLGKMQNGILNYSFAFVSFFAAAAALGLDGFLTRQLLIKPGNKNRLLGTALRMRFVAGFLILPLIYVSYLLINSFNPVGTPLYFILVVGLIGILQSVSIIDSYFQSRTQGRFIMYVQVSANLISAILKVCLIWFSAPLAAFVYALAFDVFLLAAGYVLVYQWQGNSLTHWRYDAKLSGQLFTYSWPLAFSAILVTLYMKIDQLMIEHYLGLADLGIYSTVVSLSESWYFIPVAIVTSVFPAIMHARKTDPQRYQKRLQNLYDLMVAISMAIAVVMLFASGFIYRLLYDAEYWPGAAVLSVHIWAGVFVFLGTASSQFLIAEGYTRLAMIRTGVGAIVNIVLNIAWIPRFGIMGAAYATLIAYFSATFLIIFIPETRKQGLMMLKSLLLIPIIQTIFRKRK